MTFDDLTADEASIPATLRIMLREIIGARTELVRWTIANRRREYLVLMVRTRKPAYDLLLKLTGPRATHAWSYDRTAFIQRLVRAQTTLPIPEVVAVDVSERRWPWRYLITTMLPGQEWAVVRRTLSPDDLAACHHQLGDAVGQLHTIRFPVFGEIGTEDAVVTHRSWPTALVTRAHTLIRDARLCEHFLSLVAERTELLASVGEAALCHDDLHHRNILFHRQLDRWQLAAILDFDKAWASHTEGDLARLDLWRGMTDPEFWSAYREHHSVDDSYALRRPLYQLLWCLEYGRATPRHLEDTRQVCVELGLSATRSEEISELLAEGVARE
ncbi:MAG: aminoglycoside phosphotransferase family protein [Chloroflexi bacterium]|nr:aminoglycoside phosphotransferase family protein [Chloroflexota bacterium]